jgi:Zn-dependent protease
MGIDLSNFDLAHFILTMAILVIAITIHEFAHAITADRLGDPTPRRQGRISLLPPDHLDPIGTVMMVLSSIVGMGIGWGKPVQTNPGNFRDPRRDQGFVAIAGPISNIIQAFIFATIFQAMARSGVLGDGAIKDFIFMGIRINLALAALNMIPIYPLDGWWITQSILPHELSLRSRNWMLTYGPFLFITAILLEPQLHLISMIIGPPISAGSRLLITGSGFTVG